METTVHTVFFVGSILFLGGLTYDLRLISVAMRQNAEYKLFWYLPFAIGCLLVSFFCATICLLPVDAAGCTHEPIWVDHLLEIGYAAFLIGLTSSRIAPGGRLLADKQSLWACFAAVALTLIFAGYVPAWMKHGSYLGGISAVLMFNSRWKPNDDARQRFRMRTLQ